MSAFAAVGPSAYWYLTRATGWVSLLLLTISVVLGILGAVRFAAPPRWPRFAVDALHRDVSLMVVVFLVLHIITSVLDGFAPISLIDAVIPLHSAYRPLWLGLGAVGFDLLLALVITSLVRRRLGYRAWRAVHWLAYACWPVAVLHSLGTGSDVKTWWMLLLTVLCVAAVVVAVLVRIARAAPVSGNAKAGATVLALAVPLGTAVFTVAGPLAAGWSKRAGTPTSLLGHAHPSAAVVAPASPASTAGSLSRAFTASLSGTASQQVGSNGAVIELLLRVAGGVQGELRVRMGGVPLGGGGLSLTGSQVDLSAAGAPAALQGKIVSLQGNRFVARVSDGSALHVELQGDLNIQNTTVTGSLSGQPVGSGR